jgi:syntaxin 5
MASAIGKDISATTIKLGKLAQRQLFSLLSCSCWANRTTVAKRKTLFDDRPVEISVFWLFTSIGDTCWLLWVKELTFIIKQDIAHINKQIAALQSSIKQRNTQGSSNSAEGKQIEEHNHNVVMLLQSKLATTSMTFKDVLEVRTQVSKGARVCWSSWCIWLEHEGIQRPYRAVHVLDCICGQSNAFKFAVRLRLVIIAESFLVLPDSLLYSSRSDPMGDGSPSRFDSKGKGRAQQNGDVLALDLGSAEEGLGSQGAFMQMQMVEQQVRAVACRL